MWSFKKRFSTIFASGPKMTTSQYIISMTTPKNDSIYYFIFFTNKIENLLGGALEHFERKQA